MPMHNPPHPGEFIKDTYLEPFSLSIRALAKELRIYPSTLDRLLNAENAISPEMAYRLSGVIGRSPESWLQMQAEYDLWEVRDRVNLTQLKPINFASLSHWSK
jgi:addiction module HigA family antidote